VFILFAFNRLDYAQNIPEYLARMHDLQTTEPEIWQEFVNGDFTVNSSSEVSFTRMGVDHAMDHPNMCMKGQGGISGITSSPATLLKVCLSAPALPVACLSDEAEQLVTVCNNNTYMQHHCLSQAKVACHEKAIKQPKAVLTNTNIFNTGCNGTPSNCLIKILSNEIISEDIQESILAIERKGEEAYRKFVEARITGNGNLWGKMTKIKLQTWTAAAKDIQS